jgi:hypothetical protein
MSFTKRVSHHQACTDWIAANACESAAKINAVAAYVAQVSKAFGWTTTDDRVQAKRRLYMLYLITDLLHCFKYGVRRPQRKLLSIDVVAKSIRPYIADLISTASLCSCSMAHGVLQCDQATCTTRHALVRIAINTWQVHQYLDVLGSSIYSDLRKVVRTRILPLQVKNGELPRDEQANARPPQPRHVIPPPRDNYELSTVHGDSPRSMWKRQPAAMYLLRCQLESPTDQRPLPRLELARYLRRTYQPLAMPREISPKTALAVKTLKAAKQAKWIFKANGDAGANYDVDDLGQRVKIAGTVTDKNGDKKRLVLAYSPYGWSRRFAQKIFRERFDSRRFDGHSFEVRHFDIDLKILGTPGRFLGKRSSEATISSESPASKRTRYGAHPHAPPTGFGHRNGPYIPPPSQAAHGGYGTQNNARGGYGPPQHSRFQQERYGTQEYNQQNFHDHQQQSSPPGGPGAYRGGNQNRGGYAGGGYQGQNRGPIFNDGVGQQRSYQDDDQRGNQGGTGQSQGFHGSSRGLANTSVNNGMQRGYQGGSRGGYQQGGRGGYQQGGRGSYQYGGRGGRSGY